MYSISGPNHTGRLRSWAVFAASVILALASTACGGGGGSPTAPPPAATRVISISGNLAFGDTLVGSSWTGTMTIANSGNATLTVTSMTGPSGFTASWTNGTIAPGASQQVTIGFNPTQPGVYSGVITLQADHTSGTNTINVSASTFSRLIKTWSGNQIVTGNGVAGTAPFVMVVTQQPGAVFGGTWASQNQSGVFTGLISTIDRVTELDFVVTSGNPSSCAYVSGDRAFNGTLSAGRLSVQQVDRILCPAFGVIDRTTNLILQ